MKSNRFVISPLGSESAKCVLILLVGSFAYAAIAEPAAQRPAQPVESARTDVPIVVDYRNDNATRLRRAGLLRGPLPLPSGASTTAATGGCTFDIECDDGNPCMIDWCNYTPGMPVGSGSCGHSIAADGTDGAFGDATCPARAGPLCGGCDDGLFCNGVETCQGGVCTAGTSPCGGSDVCSESLDVCHPPCGSNADCINLNDTTKLHCNGDETCENGVCIASTNPCGSGATCGEWKCRFEGPIVIPPVICTTTQDCILAAGTGTCDVSGPVCLPGRCCTNNASEPACTRRVKCDDVGGGACIASSCDTAGGLFYGTDQGKMQMVSNREPFLCVTDIDSVPFNCPKYSGGIAPYGSITQIVGSVSESLVANPLTGVPLHRLGDDYKLSNDPSYMALHFLRFVVGVVESGRIVVELYDASSNFIEDVYFFASGTIDIQVVNFLPPLTIPSEGFVVVRVAPEYSPNAHILWAASDAADVGVNDPGVLWVNDGPVSNFLTPDPGILAFELEGENTTAPLGACCQSGGGCTDGVLAWVCKGGGNTFLGVGSACAQTTACDTGACCNPANGDCSVGSDAECASSGGQFQGNGTDCDPDCCRQPLAGYTGVDNCQDAVVHTIAIPPPGDPPRVVTITGDNSTATSNSLDICCLPYAYCAPALVWWEAFETDNCSMIRIDYCCTDPVKQPVYPAYITLADQCPCFARIANQPQPNPYKYPEPPWARGAPYCDDENLWATFGPLPGGRYYIPVDGYVPGSSFGEYQLHITADACPTAACCLGDQCVDGVNQFECDALGGTFLAPPQKVPAVADCSGDPCATGSCCAGPGECFDRYAGEPVTQTYCHSVYGTYSGGVACHGGTCSSDASVSCSAPIDCPPNDACNGTPQQLAQPTRCAICDFEGVSNCQKFDDVLSFALSDRHLGDAGLVAADDFVPLGTSLNRVCAWGFYIDGDPSIPGSLDDCGPAVTTDYFRVRVYTNDSNNGRMPGTLVGESAATSQRGIVPYSVLLSRIRNEMYGYQLTLDTPINGLAAGQVYWLEVSNDPTISGPPTCMWFWSQKTQTSTSYSYNGTNAGYTPGFESPYDFAFCTDFALQPSELGSQTGACCQCDGSCSAKTLVDCDDVNGIWDITHKTCAGVTCPAGPPANDDCVDGPMVITNGEYTFNNQCATTDGFGPSPSDWGESQIDFDLWYTYIAPTNCALTVSMCPTALRFDSMLAVHSHCPGRTLGNCDPTVCPPCPLDAVTSVATLAGSAQDESCTIVAVGGAGFWNSNDQIGRPALPGECFLIRVGSFPGSRGTGILSVSCIDTAPPPVADPTGISKPRFVSFSMPGAATAAAGATALRVRLKSLHQVDPPYTAGASIPFTLFEGQSMWVGPPVQYVEGDPGSTPFMASKLQCVPYYQDWSTIPLLHVSGEAIVPSSSYGVEYLAASCAGSESSCAAVSRALEVKTTRWGDVIINELANFADISALVAKFQNKPGAPIKARAKLSAGDARGLINIAPNVGFGDIAVDVDAFKGKPYPYKPGKCTGNPAKACISDADCAAQGTTGPCILCP